jgi:hypothetical protein
MNRGSDRNRSLPVSAGYLALTRPGGWGGEVRIGQAAVQHFSNVTWVVQKLENGSVLTRRWP